MQNHGDSILRLAKRFGFVVACALFSALLYMVYTNADELYRNLKTPAAPVEGHATSPPAAPLSPEDHTPSLPAAPDSAILSITTDPVDAAIFIDGVSVGVAPLSMHALSSGTHLFSIEKKDYVALDTLIVLEDGQFDLTFTLRERRQAPSLAAGDTPSQTQAPATPADHTPLPDIARAPRETATPGLEAPPPARSDAFALNRPRRVSIPFKWQSEAYAFMASKVFTASKAGPGDSGRPADNTPSISQAQAPATPADLPAPADHTPLPDIAQAPRGGATPGLNAPPRPRNDVLDLDGPRHVSVPFEWQNEALAFMASEGGPVVFDRPAAVPTPADHTPLPDIAQAPREEATPGLKDDRPGRPDPRKGSLRSAPPRPEVGELRVASEPPGASVWLNDQLLGETPLLIRQVEAAPQQLTLRLPGYEELHENVVVKPRRTSIVNGQLKQLSDAHLPWRTYTELSTLAKKRKTTLMAALYGKPTLQVGEAENYRVRRVNGALLPVEYYWDFGDGAFAEGNNVVHRYRKAGQYTLKVLVRNSQGIDMDSLLITVTGPPLADLQEQTVTIERAPVTLARNTAPGPEAKTPARKQAAAPARLASLHAPESMIWPRTGYTWVVATHFHRDAAERDKRHFREAGYRTGIIVDSSGQGSTVYRVVMGRFSTPEEALPARALLPPDIPGGAWLQDLADVSVE